MLAALGDDRSLPGAALLRRAGYEQLMVDWLADTSCRISEPSEPTKTSTRQRRRRSR
jgi:hypothetical protein